MKNMDARTALTKVPTGAAERMLGVCAATLRNWHRRGKIKATRTAGGRMQWDVAEYMERESAGKGA